MSHNLDDYEEVPVRIRQFFEKYPEGSLGREKVEYRELPVVTKAGELVNQLHVIYHAVAHRTPDDPRPGQGTASEPIPGLTPYTKGSELMNAETSAWGRALVALGFVAKKVASANEVRARQEPKPRVNGGKLSGAQHGLLQRLHSKIKPPEDWLRAQLVAAGVSNVEDIKTAVAGLTKAQASALIEAYAELEQ